VARPIPDEPPAIMSALNQRRRGTPKITCDDSDFALEAGEVFVSDLDFCHGEVVKCGGKS
jgi:hypothetical protein